MEVCIKEVSGKEDINFLWSMLYEAASVSESLRILGQEKTLMLPEINKYLGGWGRSSDYGVIAYDVRDNKYLGAAWYRLFSANDHGYGYLSEDIPEISMAVIPDMRGKGIGTLLLRALIQHATGAGYTALSLSVSRDNKAKNLYDKMGFVDAGVSSQHDASVTMQLTLVNKKGFVE